MNKPGWRIGALVLTVVWLFTVVVNYYIVHKPFDLANALAILNVLGDLCVAVALFALGSAIGRRVLRARDFAEPLEALALETGIGLGAISFTTFALGWLGLLNPIIFWAILLAALFLLRGDLRAAWRNAGTIRLEIHSPFERALAWFCALACVISFFFALTPPTGWDALQYHLIGPKLAIEHGRSLPPPDNVSLNYPGLVEMLFLAAMLLKGDIAAQLMHWGYLLLIAGLVFAFAKRYFTGATAWLSMALLLAAPSFLVTATWAYNDMALVFYSFAALFLAIRGREKNQARLFAISGIFAGLALGEKYTASIVVLAIGLLIVRPHRKAFWHAIVFGVCAALVGASWYFRNLIFVGNPVYPFVWGGANWDAFRAAWYSRFGTGLLNQPLELLLTPWSVTMGGRQDFQGTIGPLLLALIPLGFLTQRKSDALKPVWFFVIVLYAFWLFGVAQSKLLWQTRLLFPIFPALALIAADAFDRLSSLALPQFSLQRFTTFLIGAVLGLTTISYALSFVRDNPLAFITGAESRQEFLARHLGEYDRVMRWANANLPPNARVFFLWETRAYYLERAFNADAILDRWAHLRFQHRDTDAIALYLRGEGYTHILLYREGLSGLLQSGYDPITLEDVRELQEFIARHLKPIYGTTPFEIVNRDGKPALLNAEAEPYAVYEISR